MNKVAIISTAVGALVIAFLLGWLIVGGDDPDSQPETEATQTTQTETKTTNDQDQLTEPDDQSTPSVSETQASDQTEPSLPDNWDELDLQEKIALNPFNCDLVAQWLLAQDGSCKDKPTIQVEPSDPPDDTVDDEDYEDEAPTDQVENEPDVGSQEWWQQYPAGCTEVLAFDDLPTDMSDQLAIRTLNTSEMAQAIAQDSFINAHWVGCGGQFTVIEYGILVGILTDLVEPIPSLDMSCDEWQFWPGVYDTDIPDYTGTRSVSEWQVFFDDYIATNTPYVAVGCNYTAFVYYYKQAGLI